MSSTLGITINVLLDIAILGLLAFVMSRAARLTPHHRDASVQLVAPTVRATRAQASRRGELISAELKPALD